MASYPNTKRVTDFKEYVEEHTPSNPHTEVYYDEELNAHKTAKEEKEAVTRTRTVSGFYTERSLLKNAYRGGGGGGATELNAEDANRESRGGE